MGYANQAISIEPKRKGWRIAVVIVTASLGFVLWTSVAREGGAVSSASAIETIQGRQSFRAHCSICHFDNSTEQKIGPGLQGLYARQRLPNGQNINDATVQQWIETGSKLMPGFKNALPADEIHDLVVYLRAL